MGGYAAWGGEEVVKKWKERMNICSRAFRVPLGPLVIWWSILGKGCRVDEF
jgi:hypothetical protein